MTTTAAARRRRLDDTGVKKLKPKLKRYALPDPELIGHYVRVQPSGVKSFVAVTRDPYGKQIWATIGATDHMSIEQAREKARDIIGRVKKGKTATEPPPVKPESFRAVAENWIKRHVEAEGLRSRDEIERCLKKYIYGFWGNRTFFDIGRKDVADLVDYVVDHHGRRQANYVLAIVRKITNWYATRSDTYVSPVVRGMALGKPTRRERVLDDHELCLVWKAAEASGTFGGVVRFALVTAQRREKILTLRWEDLDEDGVWHVQTEKREKNTGGDLVLPQVALDVVHRQPRYKSNPYVFAGRGHGPFNGLSKAKAALDVAAGVTGWTVHDCRRTARSLMARAGVPSDHAERVLGHAIAGVEGVYNRHAYRDEKRIALSKLAALIEEIVNGAPDKVVPLRREAHANA